MARGKRVPMPKMKDKKVFSHTAVRGKKINVVNRSNARGGGYL